MASAQRPFFAGSKPIGVPELAARFRTPEPSTPSTTPSDIANRIGDDDTSTSTTQILPLEARGDAELIKRISSWPRENQPFWYVNQQHIDKHLNRPTPAPKECSTVSYKRFGNLERIFSYICFYSIY